MKPTLPHALLLALLLLTPQVELSAADAPKAAKQAPKKQDRPTPPTRAS